MLKVCAGFLALVLLFSVSERVNAQPNWSWARGIHTSSAEYGRDVATDPLSGDVVMVGFYNSSLASFFGPGFSGSVKGGFVAKYDVIGNLVWAFKIGDNQNNSCNSVAIDSSGNIYVAGIFELTTDFKGVLTGAANLTATGAQDAFLAKYNSAGALIWVKKGGGSGNDEAYSVSINSSLVFLTGYYTGSATFSSANSVANNPTQNYFLAAYDLSGTLQWFSDGGAPQATFGKSVTADNSAVFITGEFTGSTMVPYNSAGAAGPAMSNTASLKSDAFVLSYSLSGALLWSAKIGSSGNEHGNAITIAGGKLFISGTFESSLTLPFYAGNPLPVSGGSIDSYLAELDPVSGSTNWARREYTGNKNEIFDISTDASGSIYVCGYYRNSLDFIGGPTISTSGGHEEDIYVACYSFAGSYSWVRDINEDGKDIAHAIAFSPFDGAVYLTGEYEKSPSFGSSTLSNDSGPNIFLARLGCPALVSSTISSNQSICTGSAPAMLTGAAPTGGTTPYTYLWQISFDNLSWAAAPGVNVNSSYSPPSLTTSAYFKRIVFSSSTCPTAPLQGNTVLINVDQLPTSAAAGSSQAICSSAGSVMLNGNVPIVGTGLWMVLSGGGTIQSPDSAATLISLVPGSNILQWSISSGACPASSDTLVLLVDEQPATPDAGPDQSICALTSAGTLAANIPPVGTGAWSLAGGSGLIAAPFSATTLVDSLGPGSTVFEWTVTNGVCPPVSDEVTITIDFPPDDADAGNDTVTDIPFAVLQGNSPLSGTGNWSLVSGAGIFYDPAGVTTGVRALAAGENTFRWTISSGSCPPRSDDVHVKMNPLKIPNAFSPNEDGINDEFIVPGMEYYPDVKLTIFNKWGQVEYMKENYMNDWNGRNNSAGQLVDDTYYYLLDIMPGMQYKGFVILKTR